MPAIVDLVNAAYEGSEGSWTWESELLEGPRTDPARLGVLLGDPAARIELAFDDGAGPVASVHVQKEPRGTCYLGMLSVHPARQSAGLGRALLAHSERVARDWGAHTMRIFVFDRRPELGEYYARRGYRFTGHREPFVAKPPVRARVPLVLVEMQKPLREAPRPGA